MFKLVIFAFIAVVAARPDIGIQRQQYGGQGFSGSGFSSASSGGSFGGGSNGELIRGDSQVIDISPSGVPSNVVFKPIFKEGPVQINTHFFLHESPDEALTPEERQKQIEARTHKHYKIIFIKAPADGSVFTSGSAVVGPQNEEKTLIYVLSKKPEGAVGEDADFQAPPAPVYAEPEVFFVKYTTQEEAENAISTLQQTLNQDGAAVDNPAQIVSALGQLPSASARTTGVGLESHQVGGSDGSHNVGGSEESHSVDVIDESNLGGTGIEESHLEIVATLSNDDHSNAGHSDSGHHVESAGYESAGNESGHHVLGQNEYSDLSNDAVHYEHS